MTSQTRTTSRVTPFLMFEGRAEEAMRVYTEVFEDARILSLERYGPDGPGPEGTVHQAEMVLNGQRIRCIDSPISHEFGFTPAFSLFVDCVDAAQFDCLYEVLGADGRELMPPGDYGFSPRFTWIEDRFGVSWQINQVAEG